MEYTVKPVTPEYLADALRVEKAAMGDHCYLADVYEYYQTTRGELTGAFADGRLVGIGKFTVLWDGSGWLETLRVEPDWQRKGVGMALYRRYMEQAEALHCPYLRMYTGANNIPSAGLARRFGLEKAAQFREYALPVRAEGDGSGFAAVAVDQAFALLEPYFEKYNGYAVMNRTYYRLNEATCRGLAEQGRVWRHQESGTVLIAGARFQSNKGLHIALLEGDRDRGLAFAHLLARQRGAGRLVCNFALENPGLEQYLKQSGFETTGGDLITMEGKL